MIDGGEDDPVWDFIQQAPAATPSDDFVERTVERALQQPIPHSSRTPKTIVAWAAAACLLISAGGWWLNQNRSAEEDLMASQTEEWMEESWLLAATEDLDAVSDEELAFLLGF